MYPMPVPRSPSLALASLPSPACAGRCSAERFHPFHQKTRLCGQVFLSALTLLAGIRARRDPIDWAISLADSPGVFSTASNDSHLVIAKSEFNELAHKHAPFEVKVELEVQTRQKFTTSIHAA